MVSYHLAVTDIVVLELIQQQAALDLSLSTQWLMEMKRPTLATEAGTWRTHKINAQFKV